MSAQSDTDADLVAMLLGIRDRALTVAGTAADTITSSEGFGRTMARAMQTTAAVTSSIRSVAHGGTELAAAWLNLPTRRQLIELARRINDLELTLDDVDIATRELLERLDSAATDG